MKNKIPDNVVYNEDIQMYDSSIKPYPTDLSAPVITLNDTVAWKNRSIHKVNQKLKATYLELKNQYDTMVQEYEENKLLFNAKFNFEPIVAKFIIYTKEQIMIIFSLLLPLINVGLIGREVII